MILWGLKNVKNFKKILEGLLNIQNILPKIIEGLLDIQNFFGIFKIESGGPFEYSEYFLKLLEGLLTI